MPATSAAPALAAAHPAAMLPCPVCAASVKGENLAGHLGKQHGGDGAAALPPRLRVEPGSITLRRRFGLGRRRVALPARVEVGGLKKGRVSAGMTGYADDYNVPYDSVPAGTYLRLTNGGSITIGCRTSTDVRRHWTGWTQGRRRQTAHLRLDAPAFVRVQYALAEQGVLTLRDTDG
jgi:hypothetical protein